MDCAFPTLVDSCQCEEKRPDETGEKLSCGLCKEYLMKNAYSESMWKARLHKEAYCSDCCKPKCTRATCTTCKVCRNESCLKRQCTKPISIPEGFFRIPPTLEARDNWLCLRCKYLVCQHCKTDMPPGIRARRGWNRSKKKNSLRCTDLKRYNKHRGAKNNF